MNNPVRLEKKIILYFFLYIAFAFNCTDMAKLYIRNISTTQFSVGKTFVGDGICAYSIAKILSLRHKLPFTYSLFDHHDLFVLSDIEKNEKDYPLSDIPSIVIRNENEIIDNSNENIIFTTFLRTILNYVSAEDILELKKGVKLKQIPHHVKALPSVIPSVAVHIRKGNGGAQYCEGSITSQQEFEFDKSMVIYREDYENFPFDWTQIERRNGYFFIEHEYEKAKPTDIPTIFNEITGLPFYENMDTTLYNGIKFPPNQYYIDQIIKISDDLKNKDIFVQIVTDDKNPELLLEKIKNKVNRKNIHFYYANHRDLSFRDQIWHDLYYMSRTDIFVRGESSFARTAELLGNHKMIISPLRNQFIDNKNLIIEICIKGKI